MTTTSMPVPERVARIGPEHLEPNALNIVVFGPGEGEAIVVVLPDGSVGVVDGCREPDGGNAAGIGDPVRELLRGYEKVRPRFRIAFVCLTHPHADHYAGLGRLMEAYEGRIEQVWEAPTVSGRYQENLLAYVQRSRARHGATPEDEPELRGLERVFDALRRFRIANKVGYKHLGCNVVLLEQEALGQRLVVQGWAPHATDVQLTIEDLSVALEATTRDGIVRPHDPNRMSGAVVIGWGNAGVLLAGDALCEGKRYVGWSGAHALAIKRPIQVVNVAHHASAEAHDDGLWGRLDPDLAIVTPFRHATGDMPPRPDQIAKLAALCTVVVTAPPDWPKSRNNPQRARARAARRPPRKIALHPPAADPSRHAVAVSLDASGKVLRLILAEGADIYA